MLRVQSQGNFDVTLWDPGIQEFWQKMKSWFSYANNFSFCRNNAKYNIDNIDVTAKSAKMSLHNHDISFSIMQFLPELQSSLGKTIWAVRELQKETNSVLGLH